MKLKFVFLKMKWENREEGLCFKWVFFFSEIDPDDRKSKRENTDNGEIDFFKGLKIIFFSNGLRRLIYILT